ncbi:methyl-accepting chemotaxis protein [Grimontia celer]|nr:methyl-accepting chemotaxis protein [Grimontia celer]
MSVSKKLYLGFGSLVGLLVAMTAFIVIELSVLKGIASEIRNDDVPEAIAYLILVDEAGDVYRDAVGVVTGVEGAQADLTSNKNEFAAVLAEAKSLEVPGSSDYQKLLQVEQHMSDFDVAFNANILPQADSNQSMALLVSELRTLYEQHLQPIEELLDSVTSAEQEQMLLALTGLLDTFDEIKSLALYASLFALVVACAIAIKLASSITKRLTKLDKAAQRIARGELSRDEIEDKSGDELASLAASINVMQRSLVDLIGSINTVTEEVHVSTKALGAIGQEVVSGSSMQADKATLIATASEELSLTISEVAHQGTSTFDEAKRAENSAQEGRQVIDGMVNSIQQVSMQMQDMSISVQELGNHSEEVGSVIKVIQGVAEQTNLLALNAAIEAARAGEFGRGFAVVADEVRALAERTTQATQEVSSIIEAIQAGTQDAVSRTQDNCQLVEIGVQQSENAVRALEDIVAGASSVQNMVSSIATAAEEQTAVTREIASDITSISDVSAQSLARAEEIADRITSLDNKVEELNVLIGKFRVS